MSDESIPEGAVEALQQYFDTRHEFLSWLGVQVDELEHGRAVMSIPYDRKLTNVPWYEQESEEPERHPIQGGVASTLIDTVGGIAMRGHLTDPLSDGVATINLNVNYLRQATGDLTATAEVIRAGDTVGVADVLVESTAGGETKPVAIGQGAYRLFQS
ncbi:PaaI family thioesterase [Halorarius halobius]|uniref:PaaI family thioesterase n=1 Tax=Halorarius halobius TaxID=2962671 RepID=UPI0020CC90FD|nr:PaaI family thioesterase [Halorarius halobius]